MPIAYDASRRALLQPESGRSLLGRAPTPGEEALAAEAARLAYRRFEEGADELERLAADLARGGFAAPARFVHPGTDGQGYGTFDANGLALLAFRGTQPDRVGDLVSDARFAFEPCKLGEGHVHAGFQNTALGLWPDVERWLHETAAKRKRLIVCGHSLGAAIATLLALPSKADLLFTLGSPRVGDADFVAQFEASALRVVRAVDCCDVVTEVPPIALGFQHLGAPLYIDRLGAASSDASAAFIEEDRREARATYLSEHSFRIGTVLVRDLADHAPINYLRAFWP